MTFPDAGSGKLVQDAEDLMVAGKFREAQALLKLAASLEEAAANVAADSDAMSHHANLAVAYLFRAQLFDQYRVLGLRYVSHHRITHVARTFLRDIVRQAALIITSDKTSYED